MKQDTYDIFFSDLDHFAFKHGSWMTLTEAQNLPKKWHVKLYTNYMQGKINYHEMQRQYRDMLHTYNITKEKLERFSACYASQK